MRHLKSHPKPIVHDVDVDDMELFTDDVMTSAMVRSAGGRSRAPLTPFDDEEATCVMPNHFVPAPPPRKSSRVASRPAPSRSNVIPAASNSLTPMAIASIAHSPSTETVKLARPKKRTTWVVTLGLAYAAIGAAAVMMLHARGAEKMESASIAQASQPIAAMAIQAPVVLAPAPVALRAPAPAVAPAPQAPPVLQMPAVEMATASPKPAPQKHANRWKYVPPAPVVAKKPEPKPEPKPAPVEETRVAAKV